MKIAVIGAGSVGSTLGKAWQRRGHEVGYGTRNPDDEKYASLGARVATNDQAAADADVVALCTPWQATREAVQSCGDLAGKVLIDCTNPLKPGRQWSRGRRPNRDVGNLQQWRQIGV